MKIGDRSNGVQDSRLGGVAGALEPGGTRPAGVDGAADGADSVQVSDAARVLARLATHVATVADGVREVRQDRVQALRQAVESGQYRIDPEAVARSFLTDVVGQLVG
jgi:flagellar biosynthesis anti-sigma factor FlgM